MKRFVAICLAVLLPLLSMTSCQQQKTLTKYQYQFFDTFDTLIQIVGYTETEEQFNTYAQQAHQRFIELNNLFDKFDDHGLTNGLAAINQQAGVAPVKADPQVLKLLNFALEWQAKTDGAVDITMGPVISVWQSYIARYKDDYDNATLPTDQELQDALVHCGQDKLVIDQQAGTVYLTEKGASLDVGAVAKGYATEIVANELQAAGWSSFSLSSGGNVRTCGAPQNGKTRAWSVGIQDPRSGAVLAQDSSLLDVVYANDMSVVTSGDYQRFYMVGDRRVHHIIDPATLMPADHYRSVTVVVRDSGEADVLSTALFILDYDTGSALAEQLGVGVMWVYADGTVKTNDILKPMLRDIGGADNSL